MRTATNNFVMSVRPYVLPVSLFTWNCSLRMNLHKVLRIYIYIFFQITVEKIISLLKYDKNNDTLHKDKYTFYTISRPILLRMRNVSDNGCTENENTFHVQ